MCDVCGEPFEGRADRTSCSGRCRQAAYRRRRSGSIGGSVARSELPAASSAQSVGPIGSSAGSGSDPAASRAQALVPASVEPIGPASVGSASVGPSLVEASKRELLDRMAELAGASGDGDLAVRVLVAHLARHPEEAGRLAVQLDRGLARVGRVARSVDFGRLGVVSVTANE